MPTNELIYTKYLQDNHVITTSLVLDPNSPNVLSVNWYRPAERHPAIRLTRLMNTLINGGVSVQDTLDLNDNKGYVEISADFSPNGQLETFTALGSEALFVAVQAEIAKMRNVPNARMTISFNHSPESVFTTEDGKWALANKSPHLSEVLPLNRQKIL